MVIVVHGDVVRLDEPDALSAFKVVVEHGTETQVAQGLAQVGRLADRDTAWIRAEAVRALAAGRVGGGWEAGFEAMLHYAAGKGWLSDDGSEVQAHVEWPAG